MITGNMYYGCIYQCNNYTYKQRNYSVHRLGFNFNFVYVVCNMCFLHFVYSLVSSHWLYHAYNINSCYHLEWRKMRELINQTLKCKDNDKSNRATRMWQRLINIKYASFYFNTQRPNDNQLSSLVNKLSMLTNITKIQGHIYSEYELLGIKPILTKCKNKIEYYNLECDNYSLVRKKGTNYLSPLVLSNGKNITINDALYYIKWTDKCNTLILANKFQKIDGEWCKYVIDNVCVLPIVFFCFCFCFLQYTYGLAMDTLVLWTLFFFLFEV